MTADVYELFKAELDAITIKGDDPAAHVVGECLRACKRAQMKFDAEAVAALRAGEATPADAATVEIAARTAHEAYERLAPSFGYETRPESAIPWEKLPSNHKGLMRASIASALRAAAGAVGEAPAAPRLAEALKTIAEHRDYDLDTGFAAAETMRAIARAALAKEPGAPASQDRLPARSDEDIAEAHEAFSELINSYWSTTDALPPVVVRALSALGKLQ